MKTSSEIRHKIPFLLLSVLLLLNLAACEQPVAEQTAATVDETALYLPDRDLGELFVAVQTGGVFDDYKTFVDCAPKSPPAVIRERYEAVKDREGFLLRPFVMENFDLPPTIDQPPVAPGADMLAHLRTHWPYLTRTSRSEAEYTTLIDLPHPFVVPGGRFREMFYWDSYFTIIGLLESEEEELALGMLRNFAYLIEQYGHIPNGNRTYFLSRSQPPFFAEMLRAFAQTFGMDDVVEFLPVLEQEYRYWTADVDAVAEQTPARGHSVWLDGVVLNRYYGSLPTPRAEAYGKEARWASALPAEEQPEYHRHLRAACESGWDFSSRWFADGKTKITTAAGHIVPVCLNSLLYNVEAFLSELYAYQGNEPQAERYRILAAARRAAVERVLWSETDSLFLDYHFPDHRHTGIVSLATVYPLYFGLATPRQAALVAGQVEAKLLFDGGVVTTLVPTGEQWDYPNGWAPLQWLTVMGLDRYGYDELARTVAGRWLRLNEKVYRTERKMMEKYNVVDTTLLAGGGEYPNQDGFGWTNGVALGLAKFLHERE